MSTVDFAADIPFLIRLPGGQGYMWHGRGPPPEVEDTDDEFEGTVVYATGM